MQGSPSSDVAGAGVASPLQEEGHGRGLPGPDGSVDGSLPS